MRVRFGELSGEERLLRESACTKARAAWLALRDGDEARARERIGAIDPRVSLAVHGGEEQAPPLAELMVFDAAAWPLAELLLEQAPVDVGYALSLGRSAVSLAQALSEARASHRLELERASLRAGFGRGHLLEVTIGVPGGNGAENEQNAAENLVRAVLGDRVFETWVGAVHVVPAPRFPSLRVLDVRAPRTTLQLAELFDTVSAATLGLLQGLPTAPYASGSANAATSAALADETDDSGARPEWTMLEVEPLSESRAGRKDDLVLASTCTPELLRCYLDGSPCASRRFSRAGERFIFVSYADDERTMSKRVARRTVIESATTESVSGVGAVTGVGFGVRTSYVDLALSNLETGLPRLIAKLRDLDMPADSFVQFFDSELADEWLSVWPDSRLTEG